MSSRGTWKLTVNGEDFATYDDTFVIDAVDGGPAIETVPLATGDTNIQPARFSRGNGQAGLSFTLTKEWTTNALAADFFIRGALLWNGIKTLALTHIDSTGTETTWDFTAAEFHIRVLEPICVTTIATGLIRGLPVLSA